MKCFIFAVLFALAKNILENNMTSKSILRPNPNLEEDLAHATRMDDVILSRVLSYTNVKKKTVKFCHCKAHFDAWSFIKFSDEVLVMAFLDMSADISWHAFLVNGYVERTSDGHGGGVAPLLALNDGRSVPSLGLGTWLGFSDKGERLQPAGHEVEDAVAWAIDAGYRHIDTAHIYGTEVQIGRAIKKKIADGTVKREDLFVTTKLWNDKHAKDAVVPALKESLKKLDLEYVDLYLIHWPVGTFPNGTFDNTDYVETWRGMAEARAQALARSVGVSNFNKHMLERLVASSPLKPAMLQVEVNLNLQQTALLAYCRQENITVTAYTPFKSLFPSKAAPVPPPPQVDDPALVAIAQAHNKTVPQVALRYLLELGVIPIPKSLTQARIEQNIQVFDFSLSPKDRARLEQFDCGYRTMTVPDFKDSPYYPFGKKTEVLE